MMILAANEEVPISPKNSVFKGDLIIPTTQTQWEKIYSIYDATHFWGVYNLNNFWNITNTLSFLWMPTLATLNIFLFMDANFGNMKHYHFYGCQFWEQKMLSFLWMPGRRPDASVVLKLCIGRREMRGDGD
jgi:hypothetical protein